MTFKNNQYRLKIIFNLYQKWVRLHHKWYHRDTNNPALIEPDLFMWYKNGSIHRKSGPSIIFSEAHELGSRTTTVRFGYVNINIIVNLDSHLRCLNNIANEIS